MILDPFQPEKPDDVARLKAIQEEVHDHFIEIVRTRRGEVLAKDRDSDIFSGQFWSGKTAVSLGLADRTGDLRAVLREKFGEKVRLKLFSTERSFFGQRAASGSAQSAPALAERLHRPSSTNARSGSATGSRSERMPQLIIIGAVLVGGWYRLEGGEARDGARRPRSRRARASARRETLTQDPKTGKYKLKDKG